jgi:agmatine deiminase
MTQKEVDQTIMDYLGVKKIIRLPLGLVGDHTDGHIDNVVCFLKPGMVLLQLPDDPKDPNYNIMYENYSILKHATDAQGRSFKIITIKQPKSILHQGNSYCVSYVNLYFAKNSVLVPVFGGENAKLDVEVLNTLRNVLKDEYKIIPIEGHIFPLGGGNIHCKTQQVPQGVPYPFLRNLNNVKEK